MHYVYAKDKVVVDQCQIDPFNVFTPSYASGFVEAEDEVTFGWIQEDDGTFSPPPPPSVFQIRMENKRQAMSLLQSTDWTATMDIADPNYSNPYLTNQIEFLTYRSQIRDIAVNPPDTLVTEWPETPIEIWSN